MLISGELLSHFSAFTQPRLGARLRAAKKRPPSLENAFGFAETAK